MFHKRSLIFVLLLFFTILLFSPRIQADNSALNFNDIFSQLFGKEASEEFYKTFPIKVDGSFSLKNINGSITISTWREEKVEIRALKTTKGDPENLKKVKIEVESSPDSIFVDTVFPKLKNIRVKVDYEVRVPEGLVLEKIKSVNGDVTISGPIANVTASTTNGRIKVQGAVGELTLSTTNGKIEAFDVRGELEAHTTNGSVELEMLSFEDEVKVETVNGSITLRCRSSEEIDAELTAKTVNGKIYLDFPVTLKSIYKSKHSLEGQIGQGGPPIYLRTVNGSIKITK